MIGAEKALVHERHALASVRRARAALQEADAVVQSDRVKRSIRTLISKTTHLERDLIFSTRHFAKEAGEQPHLFETPTPEAAEEAFKLATDESGGATRRILAFLCTVGALVAILPPSGPVSLWYALRVAVVGILALVALDRPLRDRWFEWRDRWLDAP